MFLTVCVPISDLLRRLSRSQNTVFCGRILLFLAKFFPLSERSGLNVISEFNLDNLTAFGDDGDEAMETGEEGEETAAPPPPPADLPEVPGLVTGARGRERGRRQPRRRHPPPTCRRCPG